ncbi:hypothetical protein FC78_GL002446 [Companilactobacillus bobalius DSM 19674]|nr:hypothetical protein FC78_GL002446 [Companilactobacillus bobalius DSM 19674]
MHSDQHILNAQEILVLIKILLASRALNRRELTNTVDGLLNLANSQIRSEVQPLIQNEIFNYTPLHHQQNLLDKIWTLSKYITQKKAIEIRYRRQHSETVIRNILPQALIFSEYYFYLVSYNPDYKDNLLYRIDRIEDYHVTGKIDLDYKDRFEEGKFRQKIQFMYPGKLIHLKFQFWGIVEAALDRIPTAKVVAHCDANGNLLSDHNSKQSQNGGSVIIEADTFGERGVMMWLLSQGQNVKVLAPENLVTNIKKEAQSILQRYE